MRERNPIYFAGSRFTKKNVFQMHSKLSDTIRMERAVKTIWLLQGDLFVYSNCIIIQLFSSGTWLPNEHIDYLSWMHISQLKAIKVCKISTMSGLTGGFQHNYELSHQPLSFEHQLQSWHLSTIYIGLFKCHNPLQIGYIVFLSFIFFYFYFFSKSSCPLISCNKKGGFFKKNIFYGDIG